MTSESLLSVVGRWRGQPLSAGSQGGSLNSLCCAPVVHTLTVATAPSLSLSASLSSSSAQPLLQTQAQGQLAAKAGRVLTRDELLDLPQTPEKVKVYSVEEMLKTCHDK